MPPIFDEHNTQKLELDEDNIDDDEATLPPAHNVLRSTQSRDDSENDARRPAHIQPLIASELNLPCFTARSQQLHLLPSPSVFHSTLISLIQNARNRIVLTSLYIGPTESDLIHVHLRTALKQNPSLKCTILLDALRGTREGSDKASAASLVAALARDFPDQVDARLHLTPRVTSTLMRKLLPKRFGEGLGLQHMKLYLADNSLIISGANLSRDYFTNRQDRYLLIEDHHGLGDYVQDLITRRYARHAYRLQAASASSSSLENTPYELVWDAGEQSDHIWGNTSAPVQRPPIEFKWSSSLARDLSKVTDEWRSRTAQSRGDGADDADVQVVPLLQLGIVGLTQETDVLSRLCSAENLPNASTVDLTTGYFSPSPSLVQLLLNQRKRSLALRILTASPRANGFFGSSFPSGMLPAAYVLLERAFGKKALNAGWTRDVSGGEGKRLEMRRWEKQGWTYHAKGLWITTPSPTGSTAARPTISLVGSSNYGRRSCNLDSECTFLLCTAPDSEFATKLSQERDALLQHSRDWEWDTADSSRQRVEEKELGIETRPLVRALTWALKGLL
ncbi:CDP-diacylglycerol--glycerol-3-phosphate 3-phosphatidyltransferase [Tilletia horrida]|nr:CDP-diacylglycerol--glycerol-3-phosphate 3-phosphatidyltransferase [Tilletia horrida]